MNTKNSLPQRGAHIWVGAILALLLSSAAYTSDFYDHYFRDSRDRFLRSWYGNDWELLKAQGIAESNLVATAVSPAGAVGVMQFMRPAWAECQSALKFRVGRKHPRMSVLCGGWMMARMHRTWTSERTMRDRRHWAWSSYNYGVTATLRAQRRSGGVTQWQCVKPWLPDETINYVYRIERIRKRL